jgi:hypothetical protein
MKSDRFNSAQFIRHPTFAPSSAIVAIRCGSERPQAVKLPNNQNIAARDARECRLKSERTYGKSFRRIAGDGRRGSAFGVTELGVWYGRGESGRASGTVGAARSRRSSSIRARITGKSSAARGRVMFPPFDFS